MITGETCVLKNGYSCEENIIKWCNAWQRGRSTTSIKHWLHKLNNQLFAGSATAFFSATLTTLRTASMVHNDHPIYSWFNNI